MNGTELASALASELRISVLKAKVILKAYNKVVGKALEEGRPVSVRNLYRLEPRKYQVVHPLSSSQKRVTVKLKVSSRLTDRLNQGDPGADFRNGSSSLAGK